MVNCALFVLQLVSTQLSPNPPQAVSSAAAFTGTGRSVVFSDETEPGKTNLPQGKAGPVVKEAKWDLATRKIAETPKRQLLDLAGLWRFAPAQSEKVVIQRPEMGWISFPAALWNSERAKVFDPEMTLVETAWNGVNLGDFPVGWVERDLKTPGKWIRYRVFLHLAGPWQRAHVFSFDEEVPGESYNGHRRFELTEHLTYAGTTFLTMMINREVRAVADKPSEPAEPRVQIELTPPGPRIDSFKLEKSEQGIQVKLKLYRPELFIVPGPRQLGDFSWAVKVRFVKEDGTELGSWVREVGNLQKKHELRTLEIPAPKDHSAKLKAVLELQLPEEKYAVVDATFPVEFTPSQLPNTQKQ